MVNIKKYLLIVFLLLTLFIFPSKAFAGGNHSQGIGVYLSHLQDEPYIVAILTKGQHTLMETDISIIKNLPVMNYNMDDYTVCGIFQGQYASKQTVVQNGNEKEYSLAYQLPLAYNFKVAVQYLSGELIVSDPITVDEKTSKGVHINYVDIIFDVETKNCSIIKTGYDQGYDVIGYDFRFEYLFLLIAVFIATVVIVLFIRRHANRNKQK